MKDDQTAFTGSSFSVPILCAGLAILAACVLFPQIEINRRLSLKCEKLKADLAYVQRQQVLDDAFLKHVGGDPDLAERLAQRQMKVIPQGTSVLALPGLAKSAGMSPYLLVSAGPPPRESAYEPPPGFLGRLCGDAHCQLYCSGIGMLLVACGLVFGASEAIDD